MKADVAFGDEARLDDEEDDPGREYGSVQVDQEAGWIREDGTLEEVAGGEADDDDREHDDGEVVKKMSSTRRFTGRATGTMRVAIGVGDRCWDGCEVVPIFARNARAVKGPGRTARVKNRNQATLAAVAGGARGAGD